MQPRLLYAARLLFKTEGQIKNFPDKGERTFFKKKKQREREHRYNIKMAIHKYMSIISLNVSGLNVPVKRHRIAEWMRKHDPHVCCLHKTNLRAKDLCRLLQCFQNKIQGRKDIKLLQYFTEELLSLQENYKLYTFKTINYLYVLFRAHCIYVCM